MRAVAGAWVVVGAGACASPRAPAGRATERPTPAPLLDGPDSAGFHPGRFIIVFRYDAVADPGALTDALARRLGFTPFRRYTAALKGFAAVLRPEAVEALRRVPEVDYIQQDRDPFAAARRAGALIGDVVVGDVPGVAVPRPGGAAAAPDTSTPTGGPPLPGPYVGVVTGRVVRPDGRPLDSVFVVPRVSGPAPRLFTNAPTALTGPDGRFTVTLLAGFRTGVPGGGASVDHAVTVVATAPLPRYPLRTGNRPYGDSARVTVRFVRRPAPPVPAEVTVTLAMP